MSIMDLSMFATVVLVTVSWCSGSTKVPCIMGVQNETTLGRLHKLLKSFDLNDTAMEYTTKIFFRDCMDNMSKIQR